MDSPAAALPAAPEPPPDSWRENVAAVVLDAAGRVLLGLGTGHNAYWHFPQGGVGGKETLEEALQRELWEEVRLVPGSYRIITCYGGLRYRYRRHNDKSDRWRGQEQCYFLVHCHAASPAADCAHTDEFCALTWVPWRELTPELFAPVKRKVISKVLHTFFPPQLPDGELLPHAAAALTPRRYRLAGRALADCPTDDRTLFGGGKEEMAGTLARLSQSLRAAHKAMAATGGRLLVLIHGAEGSGRKQCLRRLAASLDPTRLKAAEAALFTRGLPWELLASLPAAGGISLILHRRGAAASPQDWFSCEQWLMAQGISVLKLYLHSAEVEAAEVAEVAEDAEVEAAKAAEAGKLLAATDGEAAPWHIIPSERRWYRDYVAARLVAEALEAAAMLPPRCD